LVVTRYAAGGKAFGVAVHCLRLRAIEPKIRDLPRPNK
jgi:hypothetical protein